jgi:hypothetical protein
VRRGGIGAYTLTAVIVDRPDHSFLGWPDPRPHRTLAWAPSRAFTIVGAFDMRSVLERDPSAVGDYLGRRLGFGLPNYQWRFRGRPLVAKRSPFSGYCAGMALDPPLRGTLDICLPRSAVDRFGVRAIQGDAVFSGAIGYRRGLIAQDRAEAIALDVSKQGYRGAGTRSDSSYRNEAGGYWLFTVQQGTAPALETLLIKVEPDGAGCLVGKGGYSEFRPSIGADGPPGGLSEAEGRRFYDPELWSRPCPG